MKPSISHFLLEKYSQAVIKYRWLIVISMVTIAALIGSFAKNISFNDDYQVFFGPDNPQLLAFHKMQDTYNKSDNVFFVIKPTGNGKVFDREVLAGIEELTTRAWEELPYANRVDSLINYQHTIAEGDDLIVKPLIEDARSLSDEALARARNISLTEPLLAGRLMSTTHETTAMNVTFEVLHMTTAINEEVATAVRALAQNIESKYPLKIHLTGMFMVNNAFAESSKKDSSTLYPIMFLIIIIMIYALTRSISATAGVTLVIVLSLMLTLGITTKMGIQLTAASIASPVIIMTLAIADSIHFLTTMLSLMRNGSSKTDAIIETIHIDYKPLFLTSATTAIGFLSLNFSDSPPFQDLGNITAIGVMVAFVYSIIFLPAFLSITPIKIKQTKNILKKYIAAFAGAIIKWPHRFFWPSIAISLILLSFITENKLRDDFVEYFDETVPFRIATELVDTELTGFNPVELSIASGEDNGISNPEFLTKLDTLKHWSLQQPEIGNISVISDTFKRLNKNLHGDQEAWYRLPETQAAAAQYLLLFELSLPFGLDLNNQLNIDKSATKVPIFLHDLPSDELLIAAKKIEDYASNLFDQDVFGVSSALMFANISERNVKGMLKGTLSALLLISFIILFALRSVRLGLISIIPNILPAGLAFGVWGILSGEVNLAVSAVTGMTLGIVVDDTVHFLTQYNYAKKVNGYSTKRAIFYAFDHVGTAIIITSIILISGFSVLAQSDFRLNSDSGTLAAITVFIALIADFLLIPCLLLWFDKDKPDNTQGSEKQTQKDTALNV